MKKKTDNGVYQGTYLGEIIFRLFDKDERKMREFHEEYKQVCARSGGVVATTKEQEVIANEYRNGGVVSEMAAKYGMSKSAIYSIVSRVARYQFINGK